MKYGYISSLFVHLFCFSVHLDQFRFVYFLSEMNREYNFVEFITTTALSVAELSVAQRICRKEFFISLIMVGFC